MKKMIALLLALVMVFALVACGNPGGEQTGDPKPSGSTPADPVKPSEKPSENPTPAATVQGIDTEKNILWIGNTAATTGAFWQ